MRRTSNALLNAAFYVSTFVTSTRRTSFNFDLEIPALYPDRQALPKSSLLYALEATLDLTPWLAVKSRKVCYDLTGSIRNRLILERDLMLSDAVVKRYSSADVALLLPAVVTLAHWFSQQTEPVRFEARQVDRLIGSYFDNRT